MLSGRFGVLKLRSGIWLYLDANTRQGSPGESQAETPCTKTAWTLYLCQIFRQSPDIFAISDIDEKFDAIKAISPVKLPF